MIQHPSIEVQALDYHVDVGGERLAILDKLSFQIDHGEALAITGPSGSGKSTLLGLLAGLDRPTTGTLRLMGRDLSALDEEGRARFRAQHVGFVFQSFQLLPNLNALENVMLPLELADVPARQAAADMLERVGMGHRLRQYPRTLSGGEQQRVALARAFVTQPSLLFADEPTGSLDAANGERVIDLMFDLHREHGSTLVLVTHDARLADRCGRRLELVAGRLTA